MAVEVSVRVQGTGGGSGYQPLPVAVEVSVRVQGVVQVISRCQWLLEVSVRVQGVVQVISLCQWP